MKCIILFSEMYLNHWFFS